MVTYYSININAISTAIIKRYFADSIIPILFIKKDAYSNPISNTIERNNIKELNKKDVQLEDIRGKYYTNADNSALSQLRMEMNRFKT